MKFTDFTDKGGRPVNDDFVGSTNKNGIYLFAAADGMGENGYLASSLAVQSVIEAFDKNPALDSLALHNYIEHAQSVLLNEKSENIKYDTADTTLAVLVTNGKEAVYAHCGDTRIYTFRRSLISEVTEDHSEAFEAFKKGDIEYSQIRIHPDRHKLNRAIGDRISWEPEISEVISINSSYSFLLCTDGFWSLVNEKEMEEAKLFSFSSSSWLEKMLKKAERRIAEGSDNLSAVAICIQKLDVV